MGETHQAAKICADKIRSSHGSISLVLLNNLVVCSMENSEMSFRAMLEYYRMCTQAILRELLPKFADLFINIAALLGTHGQHQAAREFIYHITTMLDNEIDATVSDQMRTLKMTFFAKCYINLGVIYAFEDKYKEALDYFQTALRIFRGHLSSCDEKFGWIYLNIANVYYKQEKRDAMIDFGKKALAVYVQCFSSGHPKIADCYQFLGMSYLYNGEISKAWKAMDIALEHRLKAKPINRISVGKCYYSFGNLFDQINYEAQALRYYLKAKEMWRHHLPEDDIRFNQLLIAIGRVYGSAEKDFITARNFLDKSLQIELNYLKNIHQVDNITLGHIYIELGKNYYHCGNYEEASMYYEKSSSILRSHLPTTHMDFFDLFSNIAVNHQAMQNLTMALRFYQQCLDILLRQESVCLIRENMGNTYNNIGTIYLQKGSNREAITYFEKSLNISLQTMTCQSSDLINVYVNLGTAHSNLNNFTAALGYLHRGLQIGKDTLPKYHRHFSTIYNNLSCLHSAKGEDGQALEYAKLSLEVRQNSIPIDHPKLAITYNTLGCIYVALFDYEESVRNFEAALAIFEKKLSDKHPTLATINANLAGSYYRLEQWDRAIDYLERSLTILTSVDDVNSNRRLQFAFCYSTFGLVKCAQGLLGEVEFYCQKAFDLRSAELSSDDLLMGASLEALAIIYNGQMKYETSLNYFQQSKAIFHRVNNDHSTLVRIYRGTGSVFYNQRQFGKALEYYTKAVDLARKVYPTNQKLMNILKYALDRVMDHFL